jgi:hypothetical protein
VGNPARAAARLRGGVGCRCGVVVGGRVNERCVPCVVAWLVVTPLLLVGSVWLLGLVVGWAL